MPEFPDSIKKSRPLSAKGGYGNLKGRASLQPAKERSLYYNTNGQDISKRGLDKE